PAGALSTGPGGPGGPGGAGLGSYLGRDVVLGIRPSGFEDAALADPGWARMSATADVTEALGSEIHVIFMVDAPPVAYPGAAPAVRPGPAPAAASEDATIPLAAGTSAWTARVSARSKITPGHPMELGVDTASLYFFDPESGRAITGRPGAS